MSGDLAWYYEQRTMLGTWSPVLASDKPDYQVKAGVARLRSASGPGHRVRAIQKIPANLRGLTLRALQELLSTDAIEVAA